MIKRIIVFIIITFTSLLLVSTVNVKASTDNFDSPVNTMNFTPDEKVSIETFKDQNIIRIQHNSGLKLHAAVIEYVMKTPEGNISRLDTFDLVNDKATLQLGVIAAKVHQVLTVVNNNTYRYATTNKTAVPLSFNWSSVIRKNIVEIQTTATKRVKTDVWETQSQKHYYYEFYFNFTKEHDKVHSIDVDYIIKKKFPLGILGPAVNVYARNLKATDKWELKHNGWNALLKPVTTPSLMVNALEQNKSTTPGNYVARIAPSAYNYIDETEQSIWRYDHIIENFAIIKIEYEINGEFIIDDVLNDPVTPEQPDSFEWMAAFIANIQNGLDSIMKFFTGNSNIIIKVAIVIAAIIAYSIFSPVIKIVFSIIKILFNLIIKALASIFSVFM